MALTNGNSDTYSYVQLDDEGNDEDELLDWDAFAASRARSAWSYRRSCCSGGNLPAWWYRLSTRQRCDHRGLCMRSVRC
jgi:hypothetical protein